jgi:hypothetical protein
VFLTVIVSLILAENPLTAVEAELGEAKCGQKSLFVATVDVPPSLGRRLPVENGPLSVVSFARERLGGGNVANLSKSSLWSVIRQVHFPGSKPGRKGILLAECDHIMDDRSAFVTGVVGIVS